MIIHKRISKEEAYMKIAEIMAKRSSCELLQVGSVILDKKLKEILAIGYNGNYAGGPNRCDKIRHGACGCIHSEINALIKSHRGERYCIFLTDSPCLVCAKAIINSGIKRVYFRRRYRNPEGLKLLNKVKIKIKQL